ncbi:MAG TPA: hypothetical protein VE398_25685 [Acidobacteriota bacterium]|nr:hypothetical protein [Acidobacteriota bacterium]
MTFDTYWPWIALFALGAYHGINPGMGWLFAVALGLQERNSRAVLRALPPIALGHLISIGLVVAVVQAAQGKLPGSSLRYTTALVLCGFGLFKLFRSRHPHWARWSGMCVGFHDLTLWSFLMASAHGAGLMLVPIILALPANAHSHHTHDMASHMASLQALTLSGSSSWWMPVGIHTLGYLSLTGLVALTVYWKLGLTILRQAWFNLDFVWALALVGTGILTLLF